MIGFAYLSLLIPTLGQGATPAPVSLGRVFTEGETLAYAVRSSLSAESRGRGLTTWIPQDLNINYDFTVAVEKLKADGIAVVRYKRPTITQIDGETVDQPPKTKKDAVNIDFRLTVSPLNEILEMKDLAPKKDKDKSKANAEDEEDGRWFRSTSPTRTRQLTGFISQFVGEVYRLSLFVGNFDSALDFAPRTPFEAVKVGDTWKRTVGYQPQKLKGKDGKQAVQRLDFTYTYKGLADTPKGKVMRVEGKLNFATDLAEFINQTFDVDAKETGLKGIPLSMDSKITFDLDPVTRHTRSAYAQSSAQFKIILTDNPDDPVAEERLKGQTQLWQTSRTTSVPKKTVPVKSATKKSGR